MKLKLREKCPACGQKIFIKPPGIVPQDPFSEFSLQSGIFMGFLSRPQIKSFLKEKGFEEDDLGDLNYWLDKLARVFYK